MGGEVRAIRSVFLSVVRRLGVLILALASAMAIPARASDESADRQGSVAGNKLDIITSAFGIDHLKDYSANQNALGLHVLHFVGFEASYVDLGPSKYAVRETIDSRYENIGGRVDLRLAIDWVAPVTQSTSLFSRTGMYLWDVDVNYNSATNELDSSHAGNGSALSVGAAYRGGRLRLSFELERRNPVSLVANRDARRMLFNVYSLF